MKTQLTATILFLFFSLNLFAIPKQEALSETIPFVTYQTRVIYNQTAPIASLETNHYLYSYQPSKGNRKKISPSSAIVEQTTLTNNIPIAEVHNLILKIKQSACSSVGDGDIKVWITVDASGKLLGIGASTQSGIEVTLHCK